jgi:chromosome segregation ATPase
MNKPSLKTSIFWCLLFAGLTGVMGACASSHVSAPDTSQAESKIKQAREADAHQYAPLALHNARQKLKKAKKLVKQKKYKEATRQTEEASVDAKLATVTARSAKAQESVKQLHKTIQTLKKQIKEDQQKQGDSL